MAEDREMARYLRQVDDEMFMQRNTRMLIQWAEHTSRLMSWERRQKRG